MKFLCVIMKYTSVLLLCLVGFALWVISEKSGSSGWLHDHFKSSTKGKHRFLMMQRSRIENDTSN